MNARNPVGICVAFAIASSLSAPAFGAVTVIGGGLARDCYEAVEYRGRPASDALKLCTRALEEEQLSRRNRSATYVNRGILFMRKDQNDLALEDFERSLTITPNLHEAKVNQGAALFGLDRLDEAMTALNIGINSTNDDARATAHYNRALIYERWGNVNAAYDDYRAALEIAPAFEMAARQLTRFQVIPSGN